jgi:hypothetical protein
MYRAQVTSTLCERIKIMAIDIRYEPIFCKETNQQIDLLLTGAMLDDTFVPAKQKCPHQKTCNVFIRHRGLGELCPAMDLVHKKYIGQLGPAQG